MLSALRGIIQRWVGMTTEVQTAEPAEAPAVPGATPTCAGDFPAGTAATRRIKRPGSSTNEAADVKRPRTAPSTPVDPIYNGINPPVAKLMASDLDGKSAGLSASGECLPRPLTAASAPAALARSHLRSQPSLSTVLTPGPTSVSACGLGVSNGSNSTGSSAGRQPSAATATGAVSGVVAAPQPNQQQQVPLLVPSGALGSPQQQQQQQPQQDGAEPHHIPHHVIAHGSHQNQNQQWQHGQPLPSPGGAAAPAVVAGAPPSPAGQQPLQLLPALQRVAAAAATAATAASASTGAPGASSSSAPACPGNGHHSPHHDSHAHRRHDALEEQVFSPTFHRPSAPASPTTSHGGEHPPQHPPPLAAAVAAVAALAASTAQAAQSLAACGTLEGGNRRRSRVPPQQQHHQQQGPPASLARAVAGAGFAVAQQPAMHAIDLNVVEGVDVDTEDDEPRVKAAAAEALGASGSGIVAEAAAASAAAVNAVVCSSLGGAGQGGPGVFRAEPGSDGGGLVAGPSGQMAAEGDEARAIVLEASDEELGEDDDEEEDDEEGADEGDEGEAEEGEEGDLCDSDEYNDENAPIVGNSVSVRKHWARRHALRQQQQPGPQGTAVAAVDGATTDTVLVASAPRSLAAAMAAALPSAAAGAVQGVAGTAMAATGEEDEEDEDEAFLEFDPLLFIRQLPPLEVCVPPYRPVLLPQQTGAMAWRKTLVLDLDETLVHSSLEAVDRSDFSFPVVFNGTEHKVFVRQRPHLKDFMVRVAALYEVVVFTASQRIYAERLLDILDPGQELVRHRIYRDSCVVVDGNYLKDLSILGRDLAHTIIVDNSPQAFGFQVDNGIPIESWYDDDSDTELLKLLPFLEHLAAAEVTDVRPRIQSQFRLRELIERA